MVRRLVGLEASVIGTPDPVITLGAEANVAATGDPVITRGPEANVVATGNPVLSLGAEAVTTLDAVEIAEAGITVVLPAAMTLAACGAAMVVTGAADSL